MLVKPINAFAVGVLHGRWLPSEFPLGLGVVGAPAEVELPHGIVV